MTAHHPGKHGRIRPSSVWKQQRPNIARELIRSLFDLKLTHGKKFIGRFPGP
jgi:hypothetical protein